VVRGRVAVGAAAAVALAVGAAVALPSLRADDAPVITPTPSPSIPTPSGETTPSGEQTHESETSMTPQEVVQADNASLAFAGASFDDRDFRISVWRAECTWCPKDLTGSRPEFGAMAITTDGFETATYRRSPFPGGVYYVHSPASGVLLVVDDANGGEWLVREDGTVSDRLPRKVEEHTDAEPREWFECLSGEDQLTWCAIDVAEETVYESRGVWSGAPGTTISAVTPGAGRQPWGRQLLDASAGSLVAWWYQDGERRTRVLAEPDDGEQSLVADMVLNPLEEDLLYWSHAPGSDELVFHVGDDGGASWRTIEQTLPTPAIHTEELVAIPGGGVLLRHLDERTRVLTLWRLDSLEEGEWTLVYSTQLAEPVDNALMHPLTISGERLMSGSLYSDDDGRTWTGVDTWR
jgi:hypothetical protein